MDERPGRAVPEDGSQQRRILGAIGNGMGIGPGQFIEASYWVMDKQDNLYAGDTSIEE